MPKRKPDQVITHRIELGGWERERIGEPISKSLETASYTVGLGATLLGVGAAGVAFAVWKLWGVFDYVKEAASAAETAYTSDRGTASTVGPVKTGLWFYKWLTDD